MAEISNAMENEIINLVIRNASRSFSVGTFVALSTGALSDTSTGASMSEVANSNNYSRQTVTFSAASGGATANTAAVTFSATGGSWGTVTAIAITDNATHGAGNIYMYDNTMTDATIGTGDSLTFATSAITISFD